MGASLGGGSGPVSDLNLTPLIDIVLVVLIIMMVNIPIQIEEMGVKLPSSKPNPPQTDNPPEQLVVAVYEDGDIALNRRLMTRDVMFYELTRRLRPLREKRVFVDAHETVKYGVVVGMVDMAREAGASMVGLARMKDAGPLAATSVAPGALPRGVIPGSPRCTGALGEADADRVLKPLLPSIQQCYFTALAANTDLSGHLTLRAVIGPSGEHMEDPAIHSGDLESDEVRECITALLPNLKYPALGAGKTAIALHPILFSSG
jgi:biopolymer transport protein ExbD